MQNFDPDRSRCSDIYDLPDGPDAGDIAAPKTGLLEYMLGGSIVLAILCAAGALITLALS